MYSRWKLRFRQDRKDKDLKLVILWKVSCTFLLSNKLENLNKFLAPYLWMDEPICSIISYEARTRHQRCRTRVRRGRTRRWAGDAVARASGRDVPHVFHVFLADSCRRSSDSGRFAQNRVNSGLNQTNRMIHAEIQKRKRCKMHRLTYI